MHRDYQASRSLGRAGISGDCERGALRKRKAIALSSASLLALIATASAVSATTYQNSITSDATLSAPITIPKGYSQLTFGIGNNATLTLGPGSDPLSTVYVTALSGGGKLVNNTTITTNGAAIEYVGFNSNYTLFSITNNGTIQSTVGSDQYAFSSSWYGVTSFNNTGTITAMGPGGAVSVSNIEFTNSGTITADGTAVIAIYSNFLNTGTIRSNNGIGAYILNGGAPNPINSGTIYGKTVGAELMGGLTNSGTITSPGIAVGLESYNTFRNTATGVVDGSIAPVISYTTSRSTIENYGTINGSVNFGLYDGYYPSNNTFIARPGSVVKGPILLGTGGDTFATNFINNGPGQFAGLTGQVFGSGTSNYLHYFVTSDASASTLTVPSIFGSVTFDLANNSKLVLTPGDVGFHAIGFAGTGSADLTVNIAANNGYTALDMTKGSMQTAGTPAATIPTLLDITSRGNISGTRSGNYGWGPLVMVASGSKFTNAGTVTVQDPTPLQSPSTFIGIYGLSTIVNSGTINLLNADGINYNGYDSGNLNVTNSGTINALSGDISSRGIVSAKSVTNSGVISTGGVAVTLASSVQTANSLNNTGKIISANSDAVATAYTSYYAKITNGAGATIRGAHSGIYVSSWSGTQIINAGTIAGGNYAINAHDSFSGIALTLQSGSTLTGDVMGSTYATNALTLAGSGSEDSNFYNFFWLTKQDAGTWTLSGNNVIALTTVSGGTLVVTGSLTSAYTIDTGATLQGSTASLLTSSAISDNGSLVFDQSVDGAFSQTITGSGGVAKSGAGTLVLTGTNSYTGGTVFNAGTLAVSADSPLGATSGGLTFNGGTLKFASQFNLDSARGLALNAGGGTLDTNGFNTGLSQAISGNGALTKAGNGTLTLSGISTYSGATNIQSGTVALSGAGSIAASSGVANSASFDISATDTGATITTLSGSGTVVLGSKTLTISNGSSEFSGVIGGTGGLTVSGGAQVLSGANTYTGGTTIASGATLQLGNGGTTGSLTGDVVDNGVLVFNRADTYTFTGNLSGTGAITVAGTGRVIFTGQNTLTGGVGVGSGYTLRMSDIGTVSGPIVNNGMVHFDNAGSQTFGGTLSGSGSLTYSGGGTLTLTGNNSYTGNTYINTGMVGVSSDANLGSGGTLVLANGTGIVFTGGGTYTHAVTVAGDPTFAVAGGSTVTWSGQISDGGTPGDVEVVGGGTLALTNAANSYSGGTVVKGGSTLSIATDHALGSTAGGLTLGDAASSGRLQFSASATLDPARAVSLSAGGGIIDTNGFDATAAQAVSGAGGLTKAGNGTLTLTGANTYSGGTIISGGTLQIGAGGSVVGNIVDNATLSFNRSDNIALASVVSGTGGLTKSNNGTLTLNGVNTYSGATNVAAGRLVVGDATHKTAAIDSSNGGVLVTAGASLSGFGKIGAVVTNNGTIVTGASAGSLTLAGLAQSARGTLAVELSPATQLSVTGAASLAGTLNVTPLSASSAPQINSVLHAKTVNGRFDTLTVTGGASDMIYGVQYASSGQDVNVVAMPQNAGQFYGDLRMANLNTAFSLNNIVMDRLGGEQTANGAWKVWAKGLYGSADNDGTSNASAFNTTLAGFIGGADYGFGSGYSLHAALAYSQSDLTLSGHGGKASTSSLYASMAGHAPFGSLLLDVAGFYATNSTDLSRDTELTGFASAKPDSSVLGFSLQAGWPLLDGDLVPTARLNFANYLQSAISETGGAALNLAVGSGDTSELRGDFGARYAHRFTSDDMILTPSVHIFLDQTLSAASDKMTMQLPDISASFEAPAAKADRTAVLIGAGLNSSFGDHLSLNLGLNSRIGAKEKQLIGTAGLRWQF
ncbi:autotransporter-associated beta strand protein [Rhizomicrobium palustre]|uniref:Autotransporter-associated beta strand protein n=1 Tax=Rhizomicrobium palustre TaxID=189966 RepID=A0A846MXH5_9PROT|nr:autotransporter-associated beta strand repeat-containing protein [Rhizomicrobium palustre]NIK88013.1 autotransporter-associated beta strand protein [Rhizomicrobium palustre]